MRDRSCSVYTKRAPVKSEDDDPLSSWTPFGPDAELESPVLEKSDSNGPCMELFDDFGPLCESKCKDTFVGDVKPACVKNNDCYSNNYCENLSRASTSLGSRGSECLAEIAEMEGALKDQQQQKIFRGMVIGCSNTGKRSLINAMFPSEEGGCDIEKKAFDLAIRTIHSGCCVEKYHFWLKESISSGKYPQCLVDTYYKMCSVFFLVYDVEDRASFLCLDDELALINQADPGRDHLIILVGNKKEPRCPKKVTPDEISSLKEKYGIKLFMEVNIPSETPNELRFITEYLLKEIH